MPSKELIERVAMRISFCDQRSFTSWNSLNAEGKDLYRDAAEAAISTILAALQEPTEGMLDAGCKAWGVDINADETRENIANEWRQMLAASALGEQSE